MTFAIGSPNEVYRITPRCFGEFFDHVRGRVFPTGLDLRKSLIDPRTFVDRVLLQAEARRISRARCPNGIAIIFLLVPPA
jgi:hypothetical protein